MRIIKIITLLLSFTYASAQVDTITTERVKEYIGKEVILKGKIVSFKNYTSKDGKQMLFLDIDQSYPNNLIGVTIFEDILSKIKYTQAELYNKQVYIQGKIDIYRDKPNLVLRKVENIQIATSLNK